MVGCDIVVGNGGNMRDCKRTLGFYSYTIYYRGGSNDEELNRDTSNISYFTWTCVVMMDY